MSVPRFMFSDRAEVIDLCASKHSAAATAAKVLCFTDLTICSYKTFLGNISYIGQKLREGKTSMQSIVS